MIVKCDGCGASVEVNDAWHGVVLERESGWDISKDGVLLCPECMKKIVTVEAEWPEDNQKIEFVCNDGGRVGFYHAERELFWASDKVHASGEIPDGAFISAKQGIIRWRPVR